MSTFSILQCHDFMHLGACTVSETDKKIPQKKTPTAKPLGLGKALLERLKKKTKQHGKEPHILKPQNQIKPQTTKWHQKSIVKTHTACASILPPAQRGAQASFNLCSVQPNTDFNRGNAKK